MSFITIFKDGKDVVKKLTPSLLVSMTDITNQPLKPLVLYSHMASKSLPIIHFKSTRAVNDSKLLAVWHLCSKEPMLKKRALYQKHKLKLKYAHIDTNGHSSSSQLQSKCRVDPF